MSADLRRRLLFILHRGLIEIRHLAQADGAEQVRRLADILEQVPSWLQSNANAPSAVEIKAELAAYESEYPLGFKYSEYIDHFDPPPF